METSQATLRSTEEMVQQQVFEAKAREERIIAQHREKESELRRTLTGRIDEGHHASAELGAEVARLRARVPELEKAAERERKHAEALQAEVSSCQNQLRKLH